VKIVKAERKRVEVVTTDGQEIRRLLWIEQSKDGSLYWGLVIPKGDIHSSYHPSGEFHFSKFHEPLERPSSLTSKELLTSHRLELLKM